MGFQQALLEWYYDNHRKLPWRQDTDPYRVWLSEIMLQQTQVQTVIDYFNTFTSRYKDIYALAKADEEEVLKLWEGLGYYSRARRLIPCAKKIVEEYEGIFPREHKAMLSLPGIGPYTAGAILSIGYNLPYPAVDGNVMRVYSRLFNISEDISSSRTRKIFEEKVQQTLPEDARHFNQALMDLGARICTPKQFKCDQCPILDYCEGYRMGIVEERPVKTKKIKKENKKIAVLKIKSNNKLLITKRQPEGLLGGLWVFPLVEIKLKDNLSVEKSIEIFLKEEFNISLSDCLNEMREVKTANHIFTHLVWNMTLYEIEFPSNLNGNWKVDYPINTWCELNEMGKYAIPTAIKKIL